MNKFDAMGKYGERKWRTRRIILRGKIRHRGAKET